jgi:hypothetical protein
MIYKIERKTESGDLNGYYWAGSLAEAKSLRRKAFNEASINEDGITNNFSLDDFYISDFETPINKRGFLHFLNTYCNYPDNG